MKILHFRLVSQNIYALIAILIPIFLFALIITSNYYLLIPLKLLFLAIIKKWKYLIFSFAFLCLILIIHLLIESQPVTDKIKGNYEVMQRTSFGFVIKERGNRIFVFSNAKVFEGDKMFIAGESYVYEGKMKNYFRSQNIKSVLSYPYLYKVKSNYSFPNKLQLLLIKDNIAYDKMVSLLFFGQKTSFNRDFYKLTTKMNIAHLFVISGFHVATLHFSIRKITYFLKPINRDLVSFLIIFNYLLIIKFPISALRSYIMLFTLVFAKYIKKFKITRIEIMAVSLAIIVLVYPYSVFGFSLPLTYISTFIILNVLALQISNYKKMLMIPFLMFFVMLPFTITFNSQISLWGALYGLIITPIFTIFYLVFIIIIPFRDFGNLWCSWFISFIKQMNLINITFDIKKTIAWIFFSPYIFAGFSFIMYEIWSSYLVKKNIWWIKK